MKEHKLSVGIASAGSAELLGRCLSALGTARERMENPAQVTVARKAAAGDISDVIEGYPWANVIMIGGNPDIPHLRGVAMREVEQGWVALTEDLFVPDPDWLANLERLLPSARGVIGGAIGNASRDALSHAAYLTDYGAFATVRPAEIGVAELSGSNIAYDSEARSAAADWAFKGEWEHVIHRRLAANGTTMRFEPTVRVDHDVKYEFRRLLAIRFAQGHEYALDRLRDESVKHRLIRVLVSPVIPFAMLLRISCIAAAENWKTFIKSVPAVLSLYIAWAVGEALGYVQGNQGYKDAKDSAK